MQTIDDQIEHIEAMGKQHYPDHGAARDAYVIGLLKERLRTYASGMVGLPVRVMGEVANG